MPIVLSPNMNLPVPVVGQEAGPQYATDINNCMSILDSHTHSPGAGIQITPDGLNINVDLPINGNNLTGVRTVNFNAQVSSLPAVSPDLGCMYVAGVDLFYNDESGNIIQITQSGGVAGSNGSISNLTPPASASYVSGTSTFVWQSAANTAANMDNGSVTIREVVANANGVTIESPISLAADYTITLFSALPGSNQPVSINSSGQLSSGQIVTAQIADSNVTTPKIADGNVTRPKLSPLGQQSGSNPNGSFTTSYINIGGSISLTVTGRPVYLCLMAADLNTSTIDAGISLAVIQLLRDSAVIFEYEFGGANGLGLSSTYPPSMFNWIDETATAGSHTYEAQIRSVTGSGSFLRIKLLAYEL